MKVEIVAPATTANFGPGFDCLGAALSVALQVTATGEGRTPSNLLTRAARIVAGRLPPLSVQERSEIPSGRGLGSSAAAISAGLLLGCAIARRRPEPALLLRRGLPLEGHPDNLAPCLYGGLCLVLPSGEVLRFEPTKSIRPVVLVPPTTFATHTARKALPEAIPHADAVASVARAAGMLALLSGQTSPTRLRLLECTRDVLHQPYRAGAMPDSARAIADLRAEGIPAVLSGAGPAVLCLLTDELDVPRVEGWGTLELDWDMQGARMTVIDDG